MQSITNYRLKATDQNGRIVGPTNQPTSHPANRLSEFGAHFENVTAAGSQVDSNRNGIRPYVPNSSDALRCAFERTRKSWKRKPSKEQRQNRNNNNNNNGTRTTKYGIPKAYARAQSRLFNHFDVEFDIEFLKSFLLVHFHCQSSSLSSSADMFTVLVQSLVCVVWLRIIFSLSFFSTLYSLRYFWVFALSPCCSYSSLYR